MKTTITAALAVVLLAGSASAALAQDHGGHRGGRGDGAAADGGGRQGGGQNWRGQNGGGHGGQNRGARPQFRDTERRDTMGGADHRGQRRSEFQADQSRGGPPRARVAPQAPTAPAAPPPRPREQLRGNDGVRASRDVAGRQQDAARQFQNDRRGGAPDARDGRRWDGDRNNAERRRYGDRDNNGDRRDWDRRGDRHDGNRNGWDRHDDRGRPHWQQGRYPPVYRSHQRYRYGYYRPPLGFYAHSWVFGEILPRSWYGPDYLLNDWWSYGLPYPPLGYDWVRVGDDALLIDSYTGRVVQVVQDIFW
jgi:Ni/Co efflux regulator RcnB